MVILCCEPAGGKRGEVFSGYRESDHLYFLSSRSKHRAGNPGSRGSIPKQDIKRVFDPYYTGENGRQFSESTGMGLYLVRQVCQRLGHKVELDSIRGEGTAVRLLFFTTPSS